MPLQAPPTVRTQALIRRTVDQVLEAFVDPAITSRFWCSRGNARLVQGAAVSWHGDMYGFKADVKVVAVEALKRTEGCRWP